MFTNKYSASKLPKYSTHKLAKMKVPEWAKPKRDTDNDSNDSNKQAAVDKENVELLVQDTSDDTIKCPRSVCQ